MSVFTDKQDVERSAAEQEVVSRYQAIGMPGDAEALSRMTDSELRAEFARLRQLERGPAFTPAQIRILEQLQPRAPGFSDWAIAEEVDADLTGFARHLAEVYDIAVAADGLIEAGRLTAKAQDLIGGLPVAMYHHTATGVLNKIRSEGLKIGEQTNFFNTQAGVYVSTIRSGSPVEVYSRRAARKHGGEPVALRVRRTLNQITPDPDDADLAWAQGRQYVTPFVPLEDVDFGDEGVAGPTISGEMDEDDSVSPGVTFNLTYLLS